LQPSVVVWRTSATLPAVALRAIGVSSTKSGAGSGAPAEPPACCTRNDRPGASVTSGSGVSCVAVAPKFPVPVALAYCSESPASDSGALLRLNSSMKSWLSGAPAFEPPP
jgi:hypothetical protein